MADESQNQGRQQYLARASEPLANMLAEFKGHLESLDALCKDLPAVRIETPEQMQEMLEQAESMLDIFERYANILRHAPGFNFIEYETAVKSNITSLRGYLKKFQPVQEVPLANRIAGGSF